MTQAGKYPQVLHCWGGASPHKEKVRCPHEELQPLLGWGRPPRRSGTLGICHSHLGLFEPQFLPL